MDATHFCNCGLPAHRALAGKDGPNKGKYFYGCPKYGTDEGPCKFFKWEKKRERSPSREMPSITQQYAQPREPPINDFPDFPLSKTKKNKGGDCYVVDADELRELTDKIYDMTTAVLFFVDKIKQQK
jgi:hypothetical protein